MAFELPKDLTAVEGTELDALLESARGEAAPLLDKDEAELTDEEVEAITALADAVDAITAEQTVRTQAAEERSAKVSSLRDRLKVAEAEDTSEGTPEAEGEAEAPEAETEEEALPQAAAAETEELAVETPETPEAPAEETTETEALTASARRAAALAKAAKNIPTPKAPEKEETVDEPKFSLIAAGDVPGISAGDKFTGFDQMIGAFGEKVSAFTEGTGDAHRTDKYRIATMRRNLDPKLSLTSDMTKDQKSEVLAYATNEARLDGGSLVAAGGWAAPSQIIYDIPIVEEAPDGILSIPEINVDRGGFQHTLGIDFGAAILNNANFGFTQTETQAAAKTVKPFIEPTDPTFIDERLQVIGMGMRAGFLTLQAYPELIKRMASGATTAFAHYKNKDRINRLLSYFSAPTGGVATLGSLTQQILDTLAFQRRRLVHKHFLSQKASFQAMAPFWLLDVIREDLAKRSGWDAIRVPDSYINQLFTDRGVNVQWVRDWTAQDLGAAATAYPTTVEIAMWYGGTFVAASGSVVNFDAVYDYDGISKNTYTAFFVEESVLVARMTPVDALRLTFDTTIANREGRTGKDDLGLTRA